MPMVSQQVYMACGLVPPLAQKAPFIVSKYLPDQFG
jgi:hypothetical protein